MNLPTGSYNKQQSAETDVDGYDVFGLPSEYDVESATGFLIARVTMSKIGGTWAHVSTVDLRGTNPQSATGGVGGVTTHFADNAFHLFDESDSTKELDFQLSAITTGNTRTITMADQDIDLTPDTGSYLANIVADTSPQLGGVLDTQGNAINAQSGALLFEHGGSQIAQFDVNDNLCINATVSPGATNKNAYIYNEGGSAGLYLTVESDTAGNSIFHSYRRAKAGPANVASGIKLFGFSLYSYQGGAYALVGQWKSTMRSATACDMQYFAGTNDLALTIESNLDVTVEAGDLVVTAGDVVLSAPGSQITLGTDNYIKHDAAAGMIVHLPSGDSFIVKANAINAMAVNASLCEWGPSGTARGNVEYATLGRLQIRDSSSNTLIRIESASKLSFYGGTAVAQAAAMTVGLTNITHTAPGTPDYALQDLVDSSAGANFGFATKDEGNTLLAVVKRLQIEVAELRAIVGATAGVGLAAH
jgi:hypothetical protein